MLERLPSPVARAGLVQILRNLLTARHRSESGSSWFTPAAQLPDHQREKCPEGYFNFGLAHGVPGVAAFLGQLVAADVEPDTARSLLSEVVSWLAARQQPPSFQSRYPAYVGRDLQPMHETRLAWCYGDAGVAAALHLAGRCANHDQATCLGLELARAAAQRPSETCGVVDAGLCHGSAGLLLMPKLEVNIGLSALRRGRGGFEVEGSDTTQTTYDLVGVRLGIKRSF